VRQGEDLGRWVRAQRLSFDKLTGAQAVRAGPRDRARRRGRATGATNYAAARQFFEREGHLRVPRKHIETITVDSREDSGRDSEEAVEHHLRPGPRPLSPERVEYMTTTKPGLPGTADVS